MSTLPSDAQITATQNTAMIVAPMARPIGDGGVSMTSSVAGRNAAAASPPVGEFDDLSDRRHWIPACR
jgi:hypothetical protein